MQARALERLQIWWPAHPSGTGNKSGLAQLDASLPALMTAVGACTSLCRLEIVSPAGYAAISSLTRLTELKLTLKHRSHSLKVTLGDGCTCCCP